MEKYGGLPEQTLSNWLTKESALEGDCANRLKLLKLPSGKSFRVIVIVGEDNNEYSVIEVSEWVAIAADVIKQPGKVQKATKDKLLDFLGWFGFQLVIRLWLSLTKAIVRHGRTKPSLTFSA